ncbi:hypothetical protein DV738_g3461, partial [Chaetothyriales sp. CBS 135597]
MFTLSQFTLLALAGTSLAAPALHQREAWGGGWGHVWEYATEVVTVIGNAPEATYAAPIQTSEPEDNGWRWTWTYEAPAATTTEAAVTTVVSTSAPVATTPTTSWVVWTTETTAAAPSATSASYGTGYLGIANKWRAAAGLPTYTESSKLVANALKTAQDSNGQLVHELNSGTFAQVLAPGNADNFESVYVGGWLCEISTLAGLNGICSTLAQGWDHSNGETGHAEILSSTTYSEIGCALAKGIWACDLA